MPVPCDLRSILEDLLIKFGSEAYWHGEDCGDYSMSYLKHPTVPAPAFFTSTVDRLMGIVAGNGHDCACFAEGAPATEAASAATERHHRLIGSLEVEGGRS